MTIRYTTTPATQYFIREPNGRIRRLSREQFGLFLLGLNGSIEDNDWDAVEGFAWCLFDAHADHVPTA